MGRLKLHHFLKGSRANGPGLRAVLWVQGCSLGCPGCFNPETHALEGGQEWEVDSLFDEICALDEIEGLTISGGEPLQQRAPLLELLGRVRRETGLSVLIFTGFAFEELRCPELLELADVLLCGRFHEKERLASGLIGSANKAVHFLTTRYSMQDLDEVPVGEVVIGPEGVVVYTGIDPLRS